MPFSTAWNTLRHVGAAGRDRPCPLACSHPKVGSLVWGRRMVVILDNARYHHACLLKPFRRQHRHVLRLDHLPPYSPELNPIERVWKLTRRLCTHNQYFPELKDLLDAVSQQMAAWQKPNSVLHRLCGIT